MRVHRQIVPALAMRCAGILLTGGASSRMGTDKATLVLHPGEPTLAQRAAAELLVVASPVIEVGPGASGLPSIVEEGIHPGPLVALDAAVRALAAYRCSGGGIAGALVLACDMPLVDRALLGWLASYPGEGSVIPLDGGAGRPQPLCARWSDQALASIPGLVARGERSLRSLLAHPDVALIPAARWAPWAGPAGPRALEDVDTPGDVRRIAGGDPQRRFGA
ncbi:MAG: hypothetical protein NVSMB16_09260 [Acidimicrobiales bacterium]